MTFTSPNSRVFSATEQNVIAQELRSLHKPGNPVFFTNVYDAITASTAASHASVPAIATASFAVAATLGLADEELSYDDNFSRVPVIMKAIKDVAMKSGQPMKPLSVDMQDGYTDVRKTITDVIMLGAVGGNIEDTSSETGKLVDADEAAARVAQAAATAKELGVPDFVINARCDALIHGHDLDEAVKRGKKYLEAGATCVYVWGGGKRGLATNEVKTLVHEFNGMLNVKMNLKPGFLGPKELKEIGVCRVSVGPELFHLAMAGFKSGLDQIYAQ